jgi:GntR family transcriptional regulator of arabinose operon
MLYNMGEVTQKYRLVSEELRHAIREGKYGAGGRLPSERELAERFNVSHMTARRAVNELVEDNLLERRPPVGTFVRSHPARRLQSRHINLLCTADDTPLARQFILNSLSQVESRGAIPKLVRFNDGNEPSVLRALRSSSQALVLFDGDREQNELREALVEARDRVVVIGNRLDQQGVRSIMTDDAAATRLAITRLREAGHRNIGILCDHPEYYIDKIRLQTWHEHMSSEFEQAELDSWMIFARTPRFGNLGKCVYDAVREGLTRNSDMTALLSSGITMAIAALSACNSVGKSVPHKFSLLNTVDNPLLEFAHPPVTCVDNRVEYQIQLALDLLENHEQNQLSKSGFHLVSPVLVERESVCCLKLATV